MRYRNQLGIVTLELAMASLLIGVALIMASWGAGLGYTWLRCTDSATAVARQEARGDLDAVVAAKRAAPTKAEVTSRRDGKMVTVTVSVTTEPWGRLLPAVPISGVARVLAET